MDRVRSAPRHGGGLAARRVDTAAAGDVVVSVDGEAIDNLPRVAFQLFTKSAGDRVAITVHRGKETIAVEVSVAERAHDFDRLTDRVDPEKSPVPKLGILGVDVDDDTAKWASMLRAPSGVRVVGRTKEVEDLADSGLMTGDTIHGINGAMVTSVDDLRRALDRLAPGSVVVLQIERNGQNGAAAGVHDVAGGRVPTVKARVDDDLPLA